MSYSFKTFGTLSLLVKCIGEQNEQAGEIQCRHWRIYSGLSHCQWRAVCLSTIHSERVRTGFVGHVCLWRLDPVHRRVWVPGSVPNRIGDLLSPKISERIKWGFAVYTYRNEKYESSMY